MENPSGARKAKAAARKQPTPVPYSDRHGKYADLHVFKPIKAILRSADRVDRKKHSPVRHVQQVQASTACNQKGSTMSDITLSAGIRQNLLSLQQTSSDLTTTQEALATGKA